MPVLDELGIFLQANGFGDDICLGFVPQDAPSGEAPDEILALLEVPGLPPEMVHDIPGPAVELPMIQCRWRGSPWGYASIRLQAGEAFLLLGKVVNQTINGVFYQQILLMSSPHALPNDEWNRPTVLFEILCKRDAQVP